MVKSYITLGNWNKHYIYIILTVICMNIYCIISGFGYHTYQIGIFIDEEHIGHLYIHKTIYYLLMLLCSFFYWLYEVKRDKNIYKQFNQESKIERNIPRNDSSLIYHDIYYYTNKTVSDSFTFITIFLFVLVEHIERIVQKFFSYCDYWMFELIIMAYLHFKLFNLKIFKHQKLSIYSVSLPVLLKTITIIFFFLG